MERIFSAVRGSGEHSVHTLTSAVEAARGVLLKQFHSLRYLNRERGLIAQLQEKKEAMSGLDWRFRLEARKNGNYPPVKMDNLREAVLDEWRREQKGVEISDLGVKKEPRREAVVTEVLPPRKKWRPRKVMSLPLGVDIITARRQVLINEREMML